MWKVNVAMVTNLFEVKFISNLNVDLLEKASVVIAHV